ncbi:hypothetical protein AWENTII_005406 [Aspergillus wentii]
MRYTTSLSLSLSPANSPWIDNWQTPDSPVTVDLTRELSHASSPAAPDSTRRLSASTPRKDNSSFAAHGSSSRHTAMVRSQSLQTPASYRMPQASTGTGKRQSFGPQRTQQLRLDQVAEYSPSEYAKQYPGDFQIPGPSALSMAFSADLASTGVQHPPAHQPQPTSQQQQQQQDSYVGMTGLPNSLADQPVNTGSAAVDMSRSTTTDSICWGVDMFRFNSVGSNVDPGFTFPMSSDFTSASPVNVPPPVSFPSHRDIEHNPFSLSDSTSLPFSTSAPPTTSFRPTVPSMSTSTAVEMKHSMSAESNSSSASQQSRAARRAQEQIMQGTRPIAPKLKSHHSSPSKLPEQHKMIRISSSDGTAKEVAAIPKASIQRPPRPKTYCTMCNDQPDGFHGEHELRRHIERVHAVVRKVWVCVDISPDKTFLANCKACRNGKRYGANYNAAAHLRRTHFNPCQRGRGGRGKDSEKRGGKGGGNHPPMEVLKHWMVQREEVVLENAQSYLDPDGLGDDMAVAPSSAPEDDATYSGLPPAPAEDLTSLGLESTLVDGYETGLPPAALPAALQTMNSLEPYCDTPFLLDSQQMPSEINTFVM